MAITVLSDLDGFRTVRGEWNALLERSGNSTLFLCWEWVLHAHVRGPGIARPAGNECRGEIERYWDKRFSTDWETTLPKDQTKLFAVTQVRYLTIPADFSGTTN
jgi:hypothetical protein